MEQGTACDNPENCKSKPEEEVSTEAKMNGSREAGEMPVDVDTPDTELSAVDDETVCSRSKSNGSSVQNGDASLQLEMPAGDTADARPSADPSEVDAKPVGWLSRSSSGQALTCPTAADSKCYNLQGVRRALIFNQETFNPRLQLKRRAGTQVDVQAIQNTFKSLDWEVVLYNDLTVAKIREVIMTEVQLSQEDWAALAIFILSHGEENGTIFAQDYPYRVDSDILLNLAADKSPSLAGKPKLVFVQACQGQMTDAGTVVTERRRRRTSQDGASSYKIPNYADFLIFQASFWDHFSFRSSETGSWFIQALCSSIDQASPDEALFDTLLSVTQSVAINKESNVPGRNNLDHKKQVPLLYSTMLRKMYLKEPSISNSVALMRLVDNDTLSQGSVDDAKTSKAVTASQPDPRKPVSGSQKSSLKDKVKDKDCCLM